MYVSYNELAFVCSYLYFYICIVYVLKIHVCWFKLNQYSILVMIQYIFVSLINLLTLSQTSPGFYVSAI